MPDFDKDLKPIINREQLPELEVNVKAPNVYQASVERLSNYANNESVFDKLSEASRTSKFEQKGVFVTNAELEANKRYRVYNPTVANQEDYAAYGQSISDKAANGLLKGVNLAATTVAGGFGMLYGIPKSMATGRLADIWDNEIMRGLDDWNTKVDQEYLPNYYTDVEKNASWYSPDNWFKANFLFDKLIKNSGFAVGAMVSGRIADPTILRAGAALGKAAMAGATAAEASQGFKMFSPLLRNTARAFSAGKNIEAATILEKEISSVADLATRTSKLGELAKATNKFAGFNDAARRTAIAAYSSAGEASFEAMQTSKEFREKLIQEHISVTGEEPIGEDLKMINDKADSVGKTSFLGNLALLSITEYAQLPKLLGSSYSSSKQAANSLLGKADDIAFKDGVYSTLKPTTKFGKISSKLAGVSRYVFDPKEAAQEGLQYALQVGTQNYYNKAFRSNNADAYVDGVLYGLFGEDEYGEGVGAFNSKEGLESMVLGGLTGALMQAKGTYQESKAVTKNTQAFINQLNSTPGFKQSFVDRLQAANRANVLQEQQQDAVIQGDKLEAKDLDSDLMHNYLSSRIRYGRYDMVMNDLNDLRTNGSTNEGLSELKQQGLANVNDTIESYRERLMTFEKVANYTNELYKSIDLRYSGEMNEDKTRKYSSQVIDKMVYAASKIANYDLRIPQMNAPLAEAGITTMDILNGIIKNNKPNAEATAEALDAINNLDVTSEVKDELKTSLSDVIELSLRRKKFMEEYDDVKSNPAKYEVIDYGEFGALEEPGSVSIKQEVPESEEEGAKKKTVDKEIEVGKEYSLKQPVRRENNTLQFAPKIGVLSKTLGGEFEVKLPNGDVTFFTAEQFKDYQVSDVNPASPKIAEILDAVIDSVLGRKKYEGIEKPTEDKLNYINGLDNKDLIDDIEQEFSKKAEEYIKELASEMARVERLMENAEQLKKTQEDIEKLSDDISTNDDESDLEMSESFWEDMKKSAVRLFKSTINASEDWEKGPLPAHVSRFIEFTNKAKDFKNRSKLKVILVTSASQKALGLDGLAQMSFETGGDKSLLVDKDQFDKLDDVKKGEVVTNGFVGAVVVEMDRNGNMFYVNKKGERIKSATGNDIKVTEQAPINEIVFSTMPAVNLYYSNNEKSPRYRAGEKEEAAAHAAAWEIYRKGLFEGNPKSATIFDFGISKGIPSINKEAREKNFVGNTLIDNDKLATQSVIVVSTKGSIAHEDGNNYKFANGRPVFKNADDLAYLNNSKFSKNKAKAIFEVIKKWSNDINKQILDGEAIVVNENYSKFLQNVLYWNSKPGAAPSANKIYLDTATGLLHVGSKVDGEIVDNTYDFANIGKYETELINDLTNAYHNVNNKTLELGLAEPFVEFYLDEKNELKERTWVNYQSYLLSNVNPDGSNRLTEDAPLYTNIAKPTDAAPNPFKQKYLYLQGMNLPVEEVKPKPEEKKNPAPGAPSNKIGEYTVGDKVVNKYNIKQVSKDVEFTIDLDKDGDPDVTLISSEGNKATIDAVLANKGLVEAIKNALKVGGVFEEGKDDEYYVSVGIPTIIKDKLSKILNDEKQDPSTSNTPGPAPKLTRKEEILKKLDSIRSSSLGFSTTITPGTSRWTKDGTKVTFDSSNRDKYGRGKEIFIVNDKNIVSVDYKQRPTSGFSGQEEVVFKATYSENPKALFDELAALETPASTDAKNDIEKLLLTEENYNSWSNVRDRSDYNSFVDQVRSTLSMFDQVVDKSKITADAVEKTLSTVKAFANKAIRDQVVSLIVTKYKTEAPAVSDIEETGKQLQAIQMMIVRNESLSTKERTLMDNYYDLLKAQSLRNGRELAELYYKVKKDDSNPELVKQVEEFLSEAKKLESAPASTDKKDDIEKRRQNSLGRINKKGDRYLASTDDEYTYTESKEDAVKWINAKYDAELASLEGTKPADEVKPTTQGPVDFNDGTIGDEDEGGPYRRVGVDTESEPMSEAEIEFFKKFVAKKVPGLPYEFMDNLIRTYDNKDAYGSFENGMMKIYKRAAKGTAFHELMEGVWLGFLSPQRRQDILNEFKSKKGSFTDRASGRKIDYNEATDTEAKERIMDDFSEVMDGKMAIKSVSEKILEWFKGILAYIKYLVGKGSLKDQLFREVYRGKFKKTIFPQEKMGAAAEYREVEGLNQQQVNDFVQDIAARMFQIVFKTKRSLFSPEEVTAKQVIDDIKDRYTKMGYFKKISEKTFDELIDRTKDYLRAFNIEFDIDGTVGINDEGSNAKDYAAEAFSVNFKKSSPYAVKLLISTLIKTGKVNQQNVLNPEIVSADKTGSSVKGFMLVPFGQSFNLLMNRLNNTLDKDDFVRKLYNVAKENSDYIALFTRLGGDFASGKIDFSKYEAHDWRLFTSFYQVFTKQLPDGITQYFDGGQVYSGSANQSRAIDQIAKEWTEGMKELSNKNDSIVRFDPINKLYKVDKSSEEYKSVDISTPSGMVDFLEKIGITFPLSTYNRLRGKQLVDFANAVSGIKVGLDKMNVLVSMKSKDKELGIKGNVNTIADLYVKSENPTVETSFFNNAGKQQQAFTDSNAPSVFESIFNSVENLTELKKRMPQLNDVFSTTSQILKPGGLFFDENGDRTDAELKVQYILGDKDKVDNEGTTIAELSRGKRMSIEINQNIKGSYYIIMPGDGSTEWMMNVGNQVDYKDFKDGKSSEKVHEIFQGYLKDEIALAKDAVNRKKLKNVGSKASELRFFKELLSGKVLEDVNALIANNKATANDINKFIADNAEAINKSVDDFINSTVNKTFESLKYNGEIVVNKKGFYSYKGLDANFAKNNGINQNSMSEEQIKNLLTFTNTNFSINNIEYHKMIFGDPYQFKIANKDGKVILDETKRIKSFLSPRRVTLTFDELNNWYDKDYNKAGEIGLTNKDYGYHQFKNYAKTFTAKDIEIVGNLSSRFPAYAKTNEADAASWISPTAYREVKLKNGQWSEEAERFHQWQMSYTRQNIPGYKYTNEALRAYDAKVVSFPVPKYVIEVLKPIVTGNKFQKNDINLVLDKFSQMPIYYQAVKGTNLEELYKKMFDGGYDYVVVESGRKVGIEEMHSLYKPNGDFNDAALNNTINIPWSAYGIQVENSYNKEKLQTLGSQLTKLGTMDLYRDGEAIGDTPERKEVIKKAVERNVNALSEMAKNGYNELLKKLGIEDLGDGFNLTDKTTIANTLRQEMLKREMSDNGIDSITINGQTGEFEIPFEASTNYRQIKDILYSIVDKAIASPKVNGFSGVQVAATMWEKSGKGRQLVQKIYFKKSGETLTEVTKEKYNELPKSERSTDWKKISGATYESLPKEQQDDVQLTSDALKFYEDEDGKRYCEVMLPNWFRKKIPAGKFSNDEELIKYLNSAEGGKILMGIGFRIPTQAINSVEVFKVKGFLPEFMGRTVVVPSEITTKSGSDFDIDKLNMYLKNVYVTPSGDIKLVPFFGFGQQAIDKMKEFIFQEDIKAVLNVYEEVTGDREDDYGELSERLYKQSLENEYYQSLEELMTLPENFERLVTPNTSKDLEDLAAELSDLRGETEEGVKNRLLDRNYMSDLRHTFITAKRWVGRAAVNITSHSLFQKKLVYVNDARFRIYLPHNSVIINGGSFVSLSGTLDKAGKYISDKLSMYANSFVDVVKDPYIMKIIYSDRLVGTFMFLERAGVPMRSIGLFMSQPIIREYVNMLDASGESSFSIENEAALTKVGKMFPTTKEATIKAASMKTTINVGDKEMIDAISKYYKDKKNLTEIENSEQRLLLQQFISYYKMAKNLFDVTQAVNYDTTSFKNADDLYKKQLTTALNNEVNPISSPSKILNSSHLGTLAKTLNRAGVALGEILKFNKPEFRNILERVIYQYASNSYVSKDKFARIAEKLSASFLDYIIQTNMSTLDLTSLVIDSNSVANRIEAAKVLYPEVKILKDFVMESSGVMGGAKTIKLRANVKEVYDENLYIGYMRELKSHPQLRDLYNDIVKLSIIQGTYQSAVSIKNIVPLEDYAAIVAPIMKTLKVDDKLKQFYKDAMFQRSNWKDKNIVPRVKPSFYLDEDGDYDPLITIDSNDIEIYQYSTRAFPEIPELGITSGQRKIMLLHPRSKGSKNSVVTVPRITTVGNTDNMVDFITGQTVTKSEFAMRKQAGDATVDEIYGYKRLEDNNGEPIVTDKGYHIYKQINLLGDGQYASEYKLFPTKSPINNGTVKIEKEIPDNDIIRFLLEGSDIIVPAEITTPIPNEPVTGKQVVPQQAPKPAAKQVSGEPRFKVIGNDVVHSEDASLAEEYNSPEEAQAGLKIWLSLDEAPIETRTEEFSEFGTQYRFTLEGDRIISSEFKQGGREWQPMNAKNASSKYEALSSKKTETDEIDEILGITPVAKQGKSIFESRATPLEYTSKQTKALGDIQNLIDSNKQGYYLLAGYAGTGKTTIAENIAMYAQSKGRPVYVLAPTNKATKVLGDKFKNAGATPLISTIHMAIYGEPDPDTGEWIPKADLKNAVIVVDESSMIEDEVMDDLINNTKNNNILVFMGDGFQLEPVGKDSGLFKGDVEQVRNSKSELTEVRRQALDSNVLKLATLMRTDNKAYVPTVSIEDVKVSKSRDEFVNDFRQSIKNNEDSVMIVATNNERLAMNTVARMEKFGPKRKVINDGEVLVAVANSKSVVNSETFKVSNVIDEGAKHELTFRFQENGETKVRSYDMYLSTVAREDGTQLKVMHFPQLDRPSLYHGQILQSMRESNRELFELLDNGSDITYTKKGPKLTPSIVISTYGYAVTAHKSQGSQWSKVFVNQNYSAPTWNAARWFYTAVTRSAKDIVVLPTNYNQRINPMDMNARIDQIAKESVPLDVITLKDGSTYNKVDVTATTLERKGYTPEEIGEILKSIC